MSVFANSRKQYDNLLSQRAKHLAAAEAAKNKGDTAEYQTFMNKAKELNPQIDELKAEVDEAERYANDHAPKFGQSRQDLEEMGRMLMAGESVKLSAASVIAGLRRNVAYPDSFATPTGGGSEINSGHAAQTSSLIDQVRIEDLTGLSEWEEVYTKAEPTANGAEVATVLNTKEARPDSDPDLRVAAFGAYALDVTTFVPKGLVNVSPTRYSQKVQEMAHRALRRKANRCIIFGDGTASPKMYGITNAKNTMGESIFHVLADVTAIGVDTIHDLFFAYGGNEELGANGRLLLTKEHLNEIGKIRGTNEKEKLFEITPDAGNFNTGVIKDGGLIEPYTLNSEMGNTLAFGDPINYMLGMFGDFLVSVDPSYMAGARKLTVMGDAMVGGNLVVDKGFVVATLSA